MGKQQDFAIERYKISNACGIPMEDIKINQIDDDIIIETTTKIKNASSTHTYQTDKHAFHDYVKGVINGCKMIDCKAIIHQEKKEQNIEHRQKPSKKVMQIEWEN